VIAAIDQALAKSNDQRRSLTKWAWISVAAAVTTLTLKFAAYALTGSVGLLSDAIESTINLAAAFTALFALWYAVRPVDRSHNYGHEKIEFFASAVEGGLILVAAAGIIWYSLQRLVDPRELEDLDLGMIVSVVAALVNLAAARVLLHVASEHESVVLEADGRHLMTDVWTSIGVVLGLLVVRLSGIDRVDPVIGLFIALNILRTGLQILRTSFDGLMDRALPAFEEQAVRQAVERKLAAGVTYHALRTRKAGSRRFVDLHLLVPGQRSVTDAHKLADSVEAAVNQSLPNTETTVHLEPVEEPGSWSDSDLLRFENPPVAFDLPDFLQFEPTSTPSRSNQNRQT
jgi:cation diffusion facilitator family transporter